MSTDFRLHDACRKGDIDTVKKLLDDDSVDVNLKNGLGGTGLYIACMFGKKKIVTLLLENESIDVNTKNKSGKTPLFAACLHRHTEIVIELLKNDSIEVNVRDRRGETALVYACKVKNIDIVIVRELLKNKSIDVNIQDNQGRTALMYSCIYENVDTIKELLDYNKIRVNIKDNDGTTALIYACIYRNIDVVKELLKNDSIDVNIKNNRDRTALITVCMMMHYGGKTDIVIELLKNDSIDVNVKDQMGRTAFFWALHNKGNSKLLPLLDAKKPEIDCENFTELVMVLKKYEYDGMRRTFSDKEEIFDILRAIDFLLCKYIAKEITKDEISKILIKEKAREHGENLNMILEEALREMEVYNERYNDGLVILGEGLQKTILPGDTLNIIQSCINNTYFKNKFLNVKRLHVYCDICGKLKD